MRMRAIVSSVLSVVVMLGVMKLSPIAFAFNQFFLSSDTYTTRLTIGKVRENKVLVVELLNDLEIKGLVLRPKSGGTDVLGAGDNSFVTIDSIGDLAPSGFTVSALNSNVAPARFNLKGTVAQRVMVSLTVTPVASSVASFAFGEISFVKSTTQGSTTTWTKALNPSDSGGKFISHRSTDASSLYTMNAMTPTPMAPNTDLFVEAIAGDTTARKVYLELSAVTGVNLAIGGKITFASSATRPNTLTTISTMGVTVALP